MQPFELLILGSSSATPTSQRNPSSQLLNVAERYFLIDCGEGTQMQLRKYKVKFQRINHIFISHLHGDHFFGLPGLLASMHLLGRTNDLHLYAPPELKEILDIQNKYSQTKLNYTIIFHPTNNQQQELLFEDEILTVKTIILNHRIATTGFLFKEKNKPMNIRKEKLKQYKIPVEQIHKIKEGADLVNADGSIVPNREITDGIAPCYSYAYCSDTCYDERVIAQITDVDCLYHEATFLEDMKDRAMQTFHSTAMQAANVAVKANVKKLLMGHFSARYNDLGPFLAEASPIFKNVELAIEGSKHQVNQIEMKNEKVV